MWDSYLESWSRLTFELSRLGLEHERLSRGNESLVHRARMGMTSKFLNEDFSHMMWLDADIEFTADDVGKLWNLDADIAVGVYRMKSMDSRYSAWIDGELVIDLDQFDGPMKVTYAGTGFMMIKRTALEDIIAYLEEREKRYGEIIAQLPEEEQKFMKEFTPWAKYENETDNIPALYMTPIYNGILESEDYYFCRIAQEAGYKIMMDPSVRLVHWGAYGYGQR